MIVHIESTLMHPYRVFVKLTILTNGKPFSIFIELNISTQDVCDQLTIFNMILFGNVIPFYVFPC